MLKRNSINVHLLTRQPGLEMTTRPAGRIGHFANFFLSFALKAHTYYLTHGIGAYFSD